MKKVFDDLCVKTRLNAITFIINVYHIWSSTYLILQSFECYENFINIYYDNQHSHRPEFNLQDHDWETTFHMRKLLNLFSKATNTCSNANYTIIWSVHSFILSILLIISIGIKHFPFFDILLEVTQAKFRKYSKLQDLKRKHIKNF